MPKSIVLICLFLLLSTPISLIAQHDSLLYKIKEIASKTNGKVSVSILNLEDHDTLTFNGDNHCVMQSVFKFPIALAILDKIDKGEFSLQHKIHITPKEMIKYTWSPMRDSFQDGNVNITFENLLRYMVSNSDNIACDVLLHHLGKPKTVEKYIRKTGIEDFYMKYNEAGMHKSRHHQYKNNCSPNAMVQLLSKFYEGKILSKINTEILIRMMEETATGPKRLKGLLPEETVVAHKTGSSDKNGNGMYAATNDVGIITLPNGKHVVIAVFINDAYDDEIVREMVIAKIANATF